MIVLKNFEELIAKKDQVKGKIVCFNNKWVDYGNSVAYRVDGPSRVA